MASTFSDTFVHIVSNESSHERYIKPQLYPWQKYLSVMIMFVVVITITLPLLSSGQKDVTCMAVKSCSLSNDKLCKDNSSRYLSDKLSLVQKDFIDDICRLEYLPSHRKYFPIILFIIALVVILIPDCVRTMVPEYKTMVDQFLDLVYECDKSPAASTFSIWMQKQDHTFSTKPPDNISFILNTVIEKDNGAEDKVKFLSLIDNLLEYKDMYKHHKLMNIFQFVFCVCVLILPLTILILLSTFQDNLFTRLFDCTPDNLIDKLNHGDNFMCFDQKATDYKIIAYIFIVLILIKTLLHVAMEILVQSEMRRSKAEQSIDLIFPDVSYLMSRVKLYNNSLYKTISRIISPDMVIARDNQREEMDITTPKEAYNKKKRQIIVG